MPVRVSARIRLPARVVLQLGQTQLFHQWRDVHAETTAQPLLQAVPAAHRIVRRAAPGLDGARRRRLLLVGAAERHPVPRLDEHRPQVVKAASLVGQGGLADDADQDGRVDGVVTVDGVTRRSRRRLQLPGVFLRTGTGHWPTIRRVDPVDVSYLAKCSA